MFGDLKVLFLLLVTKAGLQWTSADATMKFKNVLVENTNTHCPFFWGGVMFAESSIVTILDSVFQTCTQLLITVFVEQRWEYLMCLLRTASVSLCYIYIYIFFLKELNHGSIALICPSKL